MYSNFTLCFLTSDSDLESLNIIIEDSDSEDISKTQSPSPPRPIHNIVSFCIAFLLKFRVVYKISDSAIVVLLRFLKHLLRVIGISFNVPGLQNEIYFPQSMHGCFSYLHVNPAPYKEYVVCPSCHLLYDPQTQKLTTSTHHSEKCTFVPYPKHPQLRFRLPCNTTLLYEVRKCGTQGIRRFKPRKVYCYYGLKAALVNF